MKHLKYLKIIHMLNGAFVLFVSLCLCGGGIFFMVGTEAEGAAVQGGILVGVSVVMFIIGVIYFTLGGKLSRGQGRLGASILGFLNMGNCPGIFIFAYVVYVCWINAETKQIFDDPLNYDFD